MTQLGFVEATGSQFDVIIGTIEDVTALTVI